MDAADRVLDACDPLDRLVILLAASDGAKPIRGKTTLQKIVFMLTDIEAWDGGPCGCAAGSSGPHNDIVDERAGCLEDAGVLRTDGGDICATRLGREVAGRIAGGEERRTLARIDRYKDVFNDLTLEELSAYVYSAYPDMAAGAPARD